MSTPDMLAPSRGRYVFDIETNGFLDVVTVIHCAVMIDLDTEEVHDYKPDQIDQFLERYAEAEELVGHYIIGFDCPVIEKLHGVRPKPSCKIVDTVNLGRLVFSDIKARDFPMAAAWKKWKLAKEANEKLNADRFAEYVETYGYEEGFQPLAFTQEAPQEFPGNLVGLHTLEAYGYRMGHVKKGDYSKEMKALGLDPWAEWRPEMHDYMIQDGVVNHELLKWLMSFDPSPQAIELEMRTQLLCSQIERNGWPFARKKAEELYAHLSSERARMSAELRDLFPPWTVQLDDFIPKRDNKTKGYVKGVPVPRFEEVEFNPNSRAHIELKLREKYNWKPTDFTPGGAATIDDDVLQKLPYPEAKQLATLFTIQKRIGQLAEGNKAWLKYVSPEGKMHGRYSTNGTVTGRSAHFDPNIGQVPAVGKEYGRECRELFTVPPGWSQLGADQSGLELRCLGSYMSAFDKGAYIQIVLNGDIHWENAKAIFGLPADTVRDDSNPQHKKYRNYAKTIIYALLYGSGDENLGSIIGKGRKAGMQIRERMMKKFPALEKLVQAVEGVKKGTRNKKTGKIATETTGAKRGWLKGLDGRKIPVRSEHAALNSLLQSAGAVICKQWITDCEDALKASGLKHGWDGDFVFLGWIHDEIQLAVREGLEDQVSEICIATARAAGDPFPSWNCPLDGDVKVGRNWAECH